MKSEKAQAQPVQQLKPMTQADKQQALGGIWVTTGTSTYCEGEGSAVVCGVTISRVFLN